MRSKWKNLKRPKPAVIEEPVRKRHKFEKLKRNSFESLPQEIHLEISRFLDPYTVLQLRSVSRRFFSYFNAHAALGKIAILSPDRGTKVTKHGQRITKLPFKVPKCFKNNPVRINVAEDL